MEAFDRIAPESIPNPALRAGAEHRREVKLAAVKARREKETGVDLETARLDDAREDEQEKHEGQKGGKRRHIKAAVAKQDELDHDHQVALFALERAEDEFSALVAEHGSEVRPEYGKALAAFREWATAGLPIFARLSTLSQVMAALGEQTDPTASIRLKAGQLAPLEVAPGQHGRYAEPPVLDVLAALIDLTRTEVEQVEPPAFQSAPSPGEMDRYREARAGVEQEETPRPSHLRPLVRQNG